MNHPIVINSANQIYERHKINRWASIDNIPTYWEPSFVYSPASSAAFIKHVISTNK